MTREEHIARAEQLLAGEFIPSAYLGGAGWHSAPEPTAVARAQVHAILALTAEPTKETPDVIIEDLIIEEPMPQPPVPAPWGNLPHWWRRVVRR